MDEKVRIATELMRGLLERMGVEAEVEGTLEDGDIHLEVKGDKEELLIGKGGVTLESLQILMSRMVNKTLREPVRVVVDVDQYRKNRDDSLKEVARSFGEKAKTSGKTLTIGPLNAHDRRIIHLTLKDETSLRTESIGDGEMKIMMVIPLDSEE